MAALSADASRKTRNRIGVKSAAYPVATGEIIYKGGLCCVDTTTGRLHAATSAAGRKFVGMAVETKTGVTAAASTPNCKVEWNIEALVNALTALTAAYIGANAFISTDNDVSTSAVATASARCSAGEIVQFEGGDAWVSLRNHSRIDSTTNTAA